MKIETKEQAGEAIEAVAAWLATQAKGWPLTDLTRGWCTELLDAGVLERHASGGCALCGS